MREENDRIKSRSHGDGGGDVLFRWTSRPYRDEYDKEEDVCVRDTHDRHCDPYELDRTRRTADVKRRRMHSRFDNDRRGGEGERDYCSRSDYGRDEDCYRGDPSGGGVNR